MTAAQQREQCPVKIKQTYLGGKVVYILGDKNGWTIWTKHEQVNTTIGFMAVPIHREELHRIDH